MSVLAAERIKLTSTRSPWWCAGLAVAATVGVGAIIAVALPAEGGPFTVGSTQLGYSIGTAVVMVMAALAVTGEYTVGTMRTTFLAVPRRGTALAAKTAVVAVLAGLVGLAGAFGSWALSAALVPAADLALAGPVEWRQVAGVGAVNMLAAVFAVAVGVLVRHTAGAVSIVLGWTLMAEQLLTVVPGFGPAVQPWLPFQAAKHFLTAGPTPPGAGLLEGPWAALAWFAALAVGLLVVAIAVARRRDA